MKMITSLFLIVAATGIFGCGSSANQQRTNAEVKLIYMYTAIVRSPAGNTFYGSSLVSCVDAKARARSQCGSICTLVGEGCTSFPLPPPGF